MFDQMKIRRFFRVPRLRLTTKNDVTAKKEAKTKKKRPKNGWNEMRWMFSTRSININHKRIRFFESNRKKLLFHESGQKMVAATLPSENKSKCDLGIFKNMAGTWLPRCQAKMKDLGTWLVDTFKASELLRSLWFKNESTQLGAARRWV